MEQLLQILQNMLARVISVSLEKKYSTYDYLCGMVGYVMDGNLERAHHGILSKINELCPPISVIDPEFPLPCNDSLRFNTKHIHDGTQVLSVYHLLLPLNNS
jgi:hypothetical protein